MPFKEKPISADGLFSLIFTGKVAKMYKKEYHIVEYECIH